MFDNFCSTEHKLKNFLRGWLLVLGPNEGLVKCATVCVKSEVILDLLITYLALDLFTMDYSDRYIQSLIQENTYYSMKY